MWCKGVDAVCGDDEIGAVDAAIFEGDGAGVGVDDTAVALNRISTGTPGPEVCVARRTRPSCKSTRCA